MANEYDELLASEEDQRKQQLRTSMYGAIRQNPDEYAQAKALERTIGVPAAVVARNLPEAVQRAQINEYDGLILSSPALAARLANDPDFARMAHDDTSTLAEIERTANRRSAGVIGGPAFRRYDTAGPVQGPAPSFSSIAYGLGQSAAQGAARAREGVRLQFADAFGLDEMAAEAIRRRDQTQLSQDVTTPAFESSTAQGLYAGGASTLQNLPGLAASIITRSPVPALTAAGVQTELDAYGKYRSRGATGGQALLGAVGEGAVEVATELIPLRTMLGAFGQPGKTAIQRMLLSYAQEHGGEQAATLLQDAIDTAVANPGKTWEQYWAERPAAAYQTFLATLVQSGVMTAGHVAVARLAGGEAQALGAQRDAEARQQIAALASASKLRARDPQTFQDFIAATSEDGPAQDIYLDARTLQQSGIDLAALAQASPTVAAQFEDALVTGGDLVIPTAEYAARIAGTDFDAALTPHLRSSEDALSLDEADRFYQTQAEEFQKAAAQVQEERAQDDAWQQSAKAVEMQVFEELKGAGRYTDDVNRPLATLLGTFFTTTASRLGITPEEALARYPLRVTADRVGGGSRMAQGTAPEPSIFQRALEAIGLRQPETAQPEQQTPQGPALDVSEFFRSGATDSNALEGLLAQFDEVDTINLEAPQMSEQEIDDAEAKFLSDAPAGNRYPRTTRLLKRVRAASEAVTAELDGQAERTREVDSALGPFSGYRVTADVLAPDEFYNPGGSLKVKIYGKEQIEAGLMAEPALTFTVMPDGELSVNGPTLGGETFNAFQERGWAEKAKAGEEETEGWTALTHPAGGNLPLQQVMPLLADVHARTREWRGEDYIGLYWSRATGALGALGDYGTAVFFQSVDQTQTPEFKKWFGDSKVVDANGKPLVVYHGTGKDFSEFNTQGGVGKTFGTGAFFTSNPKTADTYTMGVGGQVMPVYLNIRKPMVVDAGGANWNRLGGKVKVELPAVEVSDQADEDLLAELEGRAPQKGVTKKLKAKSTTLKKLFPGELDYSDDFASTDDLARWARSQGYDGLVINNVVDQGATGTFASDESQAPSTLYVAFSPTQIKSAIGNRGTFDPNDPSILNQPTEAQEGNRGEISFARDITQTPSVITLFKNADLSTFLHEMGHFQLEVLANIASQPNAPAEIVADMGTALKWFGVPDLATWRGMSLEERRPYHEQFARGFEAYLFEGKAPSAELQGLFARFRSWLINVYKSIKALNVEINDDIRGVFDRMLATDEAIRDAEARRGMAPLFTSAEQMGDAAAWADYQRLGAQATQDATETLQTRSLRGMRWLDNARGRILKQMQKDAKEKRQAVEAEVKAEVRAEPVYAAMRFLRTGEMVAPDGEQVKVEKGHRLDTAALAEMYPESMLARPALEKLRGMTRKEGLHPNLVAQMFGFTSGDHLVRELTTAQPEATVIEGMTDQRMLERYGDLTDPDTLARAVDEAIHNEARARFVAAELKALNQATGPVRALTKAAKDFAETMIARKKIRDIKPKQHAAAETRAAKAAEKALAAGDTAQAATEKRNQLVQNYAARTAYDALTEIEKATRYLRKFGTEGPRKSIDAEYIDQIDQLLERFDLRASVPLSAAQKRASLLSWVESQRAQGFDPDVPEELLTEALRKPYREMTLEELRGLVDTVKQIEHLGRLKHKLLTAQDDRAFEAARDEIVASIQENAKKSLPEERDSDRGFLVSARRVFRYAVAIHRKFASLARGFDGYKDGGPAWEYLVRNMNARGDFEATEIEKATVALTRMLTPVTDKSRGKLAQLDYFPAIGKSFSREQRISMALNMGNETNLERLLTGERLSPAQLQQVVGTLSREDAEFVNQAWEFLDSYWPQIAEKQRRLTGKAPEKVEAVPFTLTLADGSQVAMRGGYYPIAYDRLRSERSNADAAAEVARQMQQGLYTNTQTRRGHTKARVDSTGRALSYAFGDVISNHVSQVIHDLAWHEYLIDANRLLRSAPIEQAVREHYGVEVLQEMKDALRDIAVGSTTTEKGAALWNHLRYGTTIAGLGFNVFNTLQNLTGITQSMSRIGTKWVLRGATHWAGDAVRFENSIQQVHGKSEFMRLRAKTMQREINDIRNKVTGKDSRLTAAYFYLQAKTQLIVDLPTWWGAYEKAMAQDEMTEDKAVALADQAVIDAQGSGQIKDLAGIQRGGAGMKLFTTFYSFFNTTFNLTAEAYGRTDFKKPGEVALFAADIVLLYSLPALLTTVLKTALQGDWDDEDKLAKKLIGDQISFTLGTVVGLRETAAGVQAATGTGEGFGYTGPASVRFFSDLYRLGKQVDQGELDEAFWKALNNTAGVAFHYPAGQINRTASGIAALMDGRTESPLALVMGAPRP